MGEPYIGMMVTPNVRLNHLLGEGGMGSVWVADHLALHNQVVVKFITGDLAQNPEAAARFEREAATAFQVKSPHVVQTFDHGVTADNIPYIVMELLEGIDLGEHLHAVTRMEPPRVVELVTQLARGLDRAHARGVVHRDIKPNNIFLCEVEGGGDEFFVKLLDFGIAKGDKLAKLDSATRTGSLMGSPFYMSPEQIVGAKNVGPKSDLWAVGVVVFEALTGVRPYDAETMGALAILVHSEPTPKPSSVRPELPPAFDAWFERACARAPEDRFGSAREMAEALAGVFSGDAPALSGSGVRSAPARSEPFAKTTPVKVEPASSLPSGELSLGMTQVASVPPGRIGRNAIGVAALLAVGSLVAAVSWRVAGGAPSSSAPSSATSLSVGASPAPSAPSAALSARLPLPSAPSADTSPSAPKASPSGKNIGKVVRASPSTSTASSAPPRPSSPPPANSNDIF